MISKKPRKMTFAEKYRSLKRQTEQAGMKVTEKDGKLIVSRKRNGKEKRPKA